MKPNFASELEDCLDEMDMREEHEILLKMCEDLLTLFDWPEYTGSDLKLRKVFALLSLDRSKKAKKQIDKALKAYDEYLEKYFSEMDDLEFDGEDEFDIDEDDLPFN